MLVVPLKNAGTAAPEMHDGTEDGLFKVPGFDFKHIENGTCGTCPYENEYLDYLGLIFRGTNGSTPGMSSGWSWPSDLDGLARWTHQTVNLHIPSVL